MSVSKQGQNLSATLHENIDTGVDHAIRVVNDVASTMQATLEAMKKMGEYRNGDMASHVMTTSIAFTSASIAEFLNHSKILLRAQSAHEYFEIQNEFFRSRASATRDHIKQLADSITPQK